MAAAEPKHGRRAEEVGLDALEPRPELPQRRERRAGLGPGDEDRDEMPERRVAERLAPLELAREKPGDVVVDGMPQRRRVRLERLDERPAPARRGRSARRAASRAGTSAPRRGSPAARGPCPRRRPRRARRRARGGPSPPSASRRARPARPRGSARGRRARRRARLATSASSRNRSSSGTRFASSASSRCVPAPIRASSTEPHSGQRGGTASTRPQWWQWSASSVWSVSATSQFGQRRETPHARQWIAGATPRRLRSRIARPPSVDEPAERPEQRRRERVARLAAEVDEPHATASARRSGRAATARRSRAQLSGRGVAEP